MYLYNLNTKYQTQSQAEVPTVSNPLGIVFAKPEEDVEGQPITRLYLQPDEHVHRLIVAGLSSEVTVGGALGTNLKLTVRNNVETRLYELFDRSEDGGTSFSVDEQLIRVAGRCNRYAAQAILAKGENQDLVQSYALVDGAVSWSTLDRTDSGEFDVHLGVLLTEEEHPRIAGYNAAYIVLHQHRADRCDNWFGVVAGRTLLLGTYRFGGARGFRGDFDDASMYLRDAHDAVCDKCRERKKLLNASIDEFQTRLDQELSSALASLIIPKATTGENHF